MTGSHQRDKSAEAFWRQLSLKEVHQSSCLKQNLFHSRMIRPVVGGGGPAYLKQIWVRVTQNRFKRLNIQGLERN